MWGFIAASISSPNDLPDARSMNAEYRSNLLIAYALLAQLKDHLGKPLLVRIAVISYGGQRFGDGKVERMSRVGNSTPQVHQKRVQSNVNQRGKFCCFCFHTAPAALPSYLLSQPTQVREWGKQFQPKYAPFRVNDDPLNHLAQQRFLLTALHAFK